MRISVYHFLVYLFLGSLSALAQSGKLVNEPINNVTSEVYDITGKVVSKSRVYFDELGKQTQSQSWDSKTKKVWATQTLYDEQGRPALSNSAAPIGANFKYKSNFILDANGAVFNNADLGTITRDPSTVKNTSNTLGAYYSTLNTTEKYQDITDRPYSRTFYDELNPGKVRKVVGGNKVDTNGNGRPDSFPQGFSHTMAAAQELYFAFGREKFLEITNSKAEKVKIGTILKNVTIDPNGAETVSFTTAEGQVLATARSGDSKGPEKRVISLIGSEGYIDIHVPKEEGDNVFFLKGITNYKVFNLRTGKELNVNNIRFKDPFHVLPPGIYRIQALNKDSNTLTNDIDISHGNAFSLIDVDSRGVVYSVNYYDYSLYYYDNAGNLKSSLPPIGFDNEAYDNYLMRGPVTHINESLKSHFEYNSLGQLEYSSSPDEGEAWFRYRRDGQIRFSQNSKQKKNKEFAYTNYDRLGRPVESGVYKESSLYRFDNSGSKSLGDLLDKVYTFDQYASDNDALKNSNSREQHFTLFDVADNEGLKAAFGNDQRADNYKYQNFVEGAVSKTYTKNPTTSTTWYSYDIYGRVAWTVQKIEGLDGVKTIDYVYDDITGDVNRVYYQKGKADEQFIHRYAYDPDDYSLVKVETATKDAGPYTEHAVYNYYESGALKRINLAKGLQGIDYVYNANGSLKAINHPSLEAAKDPGKDTNDVFGMLIDYHKGDYKRAGLHMDSSTSGTDQFNGNIKGIRWKNGAIDDTSAPEKSFSYQYNRNNWLTNATYAYNGKVTSVITKKNETISKSIIAAKEIILEPNIEIIGTSNTIDLDIKETQTQNTDDYKVSGITYDANGNIQSLKRNKHTENGSNKMDDLVYHYDPKKPNQLKQVQDKVTVATNAADIKHQASSNNYSYNSIGQLVKNTSEDVAYEYNASGLVTEVKKNGIPRVKFFYNDRNQRIEKKSYSDKGSLIYNEHYVRDASGIPLAIYRKGKLDEHTINGAGRLGVYKRSSGNSLYELSDHLGNVRAVVGKTGTGQSIALSGGTDYYPFGMPMPNRNVKGDYRYAFQGQEKDDETGKEAFELRLWDARIGRWLTTDPAGQYASPYLGMGNNPVSRIDPDGGMDGEVTALPPLEEILVVGTPPESNTYWNFIQQNPQFDMLLNHLAFHDDLSKEVLNSIEYSIFSEYASGKFLGTNENPFMGEDSLEKFYRGFGPFLRRKLVDVNSKLSTEFAKDLTNIVIGSYATDNSRTGLAKLFWDFAGTIGVIRDVSILAGKTIHSKEIHYLEKNGPKHFKYNPDYFREGIKVTFPK